MESNKINEFVTTVCEQVRWKKAHGMITEEIKNHIIDQKNALLANGLDDETATDKAIKEMGDPVNIGAELDRIHKPKIEWSIIFLTGIILSLGFAIRLLFTNDLHMEGMLSTSIISAIIGMVLMLTIFYLDFTIIGKYAKAISIGLFVVSIGLMAISSIVNGHDVYVNYTYIKFILLLFPTAFSGIIYNMRTKGYLGILLCGIFIAVSGFIPLMISSVSSLIVYILSCLVLITFAIVKGWFNVNKLKAILMVYLPISIFFFFLIIVSHPYRLKRILVAINPYTDPQGAGYVGVTIRNMLAKAKFWGQTDLGADFSKMLPNINTDYMLAYLIQRLGWISFIVIMLLMIAFIVRSFIICSRQKSVLGGLVSTSVLITFTMQVVGYVLSNLGFQLLSPLTLPLISYSGIATVINMVLIGIMLSVFKSDHLIYDNQITSKFSKNKRIEIVNGKIIIDLNR